MVCYVIRKYQARASYFESQISTFEKLKGEHDAESDRGQQENKARRDLTGISA